MWSQNKTQTHHLLFSSQQQFAIQLRRREAEQLLRHKPRC